MLFSARTRRHAGVRMEKGMKKKEKEVLFKQVADPDVKGRCHGDYNDRSDLLSLGDAEALAEFYLRQHRRRSASTLPPCVSDMWEL